VASVPPPTGEPALPPDTPPDPGSGRRSRVPPLVALGVAVLLVAGVAIAALGHSSTGHSPHPSPPAGGANGTAAPVQPIDLSAILVQPADLPPGFTTVSPPGPRPLPSGPASGGACANPLFGHATASASSAYSYQQGRDTLVSNIEEADSPADIAAERSWVEGPVYPGCISQLVRSSLSQLGGSGLQLGTTTVTHNPGPLPLSGDEIVARTDYVDGGQPQVQTERFIHLYRGAYEAALDISFCTCGPFPDPIVTNGSITTMAARMALLPS
jgi:hypothetical protein